MYQENPRVKECHVQLTKLTKSEIEKHTNKEENKPKKLPPSSRANNLPIENRRRSKRISAMVPKAQIAKPQQKCRSKVAKSMFSQANLFFKANKSQIDQFMGDFSPISIKKTTATKPPSARPVIKENRRQSTQVRSNPPTTKGKSRSKVSPEIHENIYSTVFRQTRVK